MKKVLFVVALGAFAACNSGANSEAKKDTLATDTTAKMSADTSAKMAADTTKKDTTKPKM